VTDLGLGPRAAHPPRRRALAFFDDGRSRLLIFLLHNMMI
jgi:hypothetical protein